MELRKRIMSLIFPTIAAAYAIYSLWGMYAGDYMDVTVKYSFVLAVPVLVLTFVVLVQELLPKKEEVKEEQETGSPIFNWRVVSVLFVTVMTPVLMPWLGYAPSFAALVICLMLISGIRKPVHLLCMAVAVVLVCHFLFVGLLDLALPVGEIGNFGFGGKDV